MLAASVYSLGTRAFCDGFINLLGGTDPAVHANALKYLRYTVIIGGVPTALNTLLSHLTRSEGRSYEAAAGVVFGGVLNIVLDPLFMFKLLLPGSLKNGLPAELASGGLPSCLMTLCENISYSVLDNLMSVRGISALAGLGVAKKINMLAHCCVRGVAQGVFPMLGYCFGSGNTKRMYQALRTSMALSVGMASVCMAAALLYSAPLVGIFINSGTVSLNHGMSFLKILCIGGPFSACAYMLIYFFQAVKRSGLSMVLALMRKGLLDIPLMYLLNSAMGTMSIVWATPLADMLCYAAALVFFIQYRRRPLSKL